MVKWWERFWGAVWMVGTVAIAYAAARWMATNAAPLDLGTMRYGLIATAGLFGLLVGALIVSLTVIGIMSGLERLLARLGYPLRSPDAPTPMQATPDETSPARAAPITDAVKNEVTVV